MEGRKRLYVQRTGQQVETEVRISKTINRNKSKDQRFLKRNLSDIYLTDKKKGNWCSTPAERPVIVRLSGVIVGDPHHAETMTTRRNRMGAIL